MVGVEIRCLWWNPRQAVPNGTERQYDLLRVPEARWMSEQQRPTSDTSAHGAGMVVVVVVVVVVVSVSVPERAFDETRRSTSAR